MMNNFVLRIVSLWPSVLWAPLVLMSSRPSSKLKGKHLLADKWLEFQIDNFGYHKKDNATNSQLRFFFIFSLSLKTKILTYKLFLLLSFLVFIWVNSQLMDKLLGMRRKRLCLPFWMPMTGILPRRSWSSLIRRSKLTFW